MNTPSLTQLYSWLAHQWRRFNAVELAFIAYDPNPKLYLKGHSMPALQLHVKHTRLIHAVPTTATGEVGQVENITHIFTNEGVADIAPLNATDPLSFSLIGVSVGKTTLTVQADAHLGDGEVIILGTLDIEVLANEPVAIDFTIGDETIIA